ncbi:MAG: hypothetical protein R2814_08215 [Flavobacteriaceae bacterium]
MGTIRTILVLALFPIAVIKNAPWMGNSIKLIDMIGFGVDRIVSDHPNILKKVLKNNSFLITQSN